MMGFYPVDPTSLAYELTSPVFPKITIHLSAPYKGKTFTIESSPDPEHLTYIQRVDLNGKAHTKNWMRFQNVSDGGTMKFTLGSAPNESWGARKEDAPPSLSDETP
jgi:putative alpha-1,2-mannosidase